MVEFCCTLSSVSYKGGTFQIWIKRNIYIAEEHLPGGYLVLSYSSFTLSKIALVNNPIRWICKLELLPFFFVVYSLVGDGPNPKHIYIQLLFLLLLFVLPWLLLLFKETHFEHSNTHRLTGTSDSVAIQSSL